MNDARHLWSHIRTQLQRKASCALACVLVSACAPADDPKSSTTQDDETEASASGVASATQSSGGSETTGNTATGTSGDTSDTGGTSSTTSEGTSSSSSTGSTSSTSTDASTSATTSDSSTSDASSGDMGSDSTDTGSTGDVGHSIHLDVTLRVDDDGENVSFLTAASSIVTIPVTELVGKPYYVSVFTGGFDQGVDLSLAHEWGIVPDDLRVQYSSPAMFASGPYDVSFIVYTNTEITDDIKQQPFPPAPIAGELSAFTLSQDQIKPGDPGFENGVVRINVEDADATLVLENRHDLLDLLNSFNDTVLVVP